MTLLELKNYFENYAILHKELLHNPAVEKLKTFFCVNAEANADQYIREAVMDLIFVLMPYDKGITKTNADNYNWSKNTAFLVLQRCADNDNESIIAAQSRCEVIANDFVTRLLADRTTLIRGLDAASFIMEPVGPMGDGHYGYICMFNLIDTFHHWVDESRWNS